MRNQDEAQSASAEILSELGPFPGNPSVHGVAHDGERLWCATGERMLALDPNSGQVLRELAVQSDAGTAFDGRYLYQLAEARIQKVDPESGEVLGSIPAPGKGGDSGLTWAEGSLWVGQYRDRKIYRIDPEDGRILRTIESDRFVTGVHWVGEELWHGTWEEELSELRRIDPESGEVVERALLPQGTGISGLAADGAGKFFCGGGSSGKIRVLARPSQK